MCVYREPNRPLLSVKRQTQTFNTLEFILRVIIYHKRINYLSTVIRFSNMSTINNCILRETLGSNRVRGCYRTFPSPNPFVQQIGQIPIHCSKSGNLTSLGQGANPSTFVLLKRKKLADYI